MKLGSLIENVKLIQVVNESDIDITYLTMGSRDVVAGSMFCAVKGTKVDGHQFIENAISAGAVAILCEEIPIEINSTIVYIQVENTSKALGTIAANFYGNPSRKLKLIGITGTNGKTSTATLSYDLFKKLGFQVGLISTIKNVIGDVEIVSTHTTPDSISLNKLLNEMVLKGCGYCFMEVSSHAIEQYRIEGVEFAGGVFTNLTHDHLDYHGTFKNYLNAKKKFFDGLNKNAFALTNIDDNNGKVMMQNTAAKIKTYSQSSASDFKVQILENAFTGLILKIDGEEVHTRFAGEFNAYNLLAVYSVASLLGIGKIEILSALSTLEAVEGRFNYVISDLDKIVGIVDYAHTPDALEKVLDTIKQSKTKSVKTITIVGCGGDRDKTKRPVMAAVSCDKSDKVLLTSDNPRTENPVDIIRDMKEGMSDEHKKKCLTIVDRREAIRTAVTIAEKGDIILLAGKGHETYQEINGVKYDFDDRKVLEETFNEYNR
jgi:UDP-N-acetylmuramoyl-L-alanyl-D-glutamate--2,6-diaminopimelate ligase